MKPTVPEAGTHWVLASDTVIAVGDEPNNTEHTEGGSTRATLPGFN